MLVNAVGGRAPPKSRPVVQALNSSPEPRKRPQDTPLSGARRAPWGATWLQERRGSIFGEQWPCLRGAHEGVDELRRVSGAVSKLDDLAELLLAAPNVDEGMSQCRPVLPGSHGQVELRDVSGLLRVFGGHGRMIAGRGPSTTGRRVLGHVSGLKRDSVVATGDFLRRSPQDGGKFFERAFEVKPMQDLDDLGGSFFVNWLHLGHQMGALRVCSLGEALQQRGCSARRSSFARFEARKTPNRRVFWGDFEYRDGLIRRGVYVDLAKDLVSGRTAGRDDIEAQCGIRELNRPGGAHRCELTTHGGRRRPRP